MARVKKVHITKTQVRKRLASPKRFDRESFRVKDVGRKGFTKLIVACPKGKYNRRTKKCKVGMKPQAIIMSRKDFGI